ncbi:hypothetical protein JCM8115_004465 [Rhodotorula mucilaginosa]
MTAASLIPRCYQVEVAAQAVCENVIVRADTGSGKTLIAVLLIRSVLSRPTQPGGERSLVVFTTPTTTLVTQQAGVIRGQTSARVKAFIGAEVDFWKVERFQQELAEADVVVCTPQVWLNILNSGYHSIRNCSLLIIDECHHCNKKHPSAEIMRQHYHPSKNGDPDRVPRVFGMTASPLWNAKNPAKAISDLEALLDARIVELHTATFRSELEQNTPKAAETLVEFDTAGDTLVDDAMLDVASDDPIDDNVPAGCAARTNALIDVLRPYEAKRDFAAIVFVEQRVHAARLVRMLQAVPDVAGWLRPAALVGHGRTGWKELDQAERERQLGMEQQAIVAKFRSGERNVLIATKVAEEGLDFRACNLVVRFDALTTVTGYIQSRGRARAADARYVVLAAQGSLEASRYRDFVQQEAELQGLYADRSEEPDEQAEPDLDNLPTYTTPRGALLSHGSAVSTLSGFCQLLKVDQFTPLQKPTFAIAANFGGWVAELRVPKTAALSEHTFVSAPMPTRRAAKQNAAFQACIALHRADALDDHLLPLRASRSDDAPEDVDGRALDRRPLPSNLEVQLVNPFGNVFASSAAHVYVFEVSTQPPARILSMTLTAASPSFICSRTIGWTGRIGRSETTGSPRSRHSTDASVESSSTDDSETIGSMLSGRPLTKRETLTGNLLRIRSRWQISPRWRQDRQSSYRCSAPPADYHYYLRVMYGDEVGTVADEEPIASIDPTDFRLHNALVPRPTPEIISPKEAETSNMRYFPISLLRTTKIPLEFFQTFSLVPSLNRHFIEASVTGALSSTFELPPINTRLLATAITAPMSQVGYDYQSLEFVGDAALQLATSVHGFLQHPKADEERLSILRSNSVDNRFLRRFALECGLSKFLLPHLLRPTTFVPETSDDATQSEDGLLITKTIGRRLLSDTLEALLGATVINSGFNGAMHVTARLGLCTGGTVPWSEREPAQALLDVPRTRAGSGLQHLEAAIGYSFQTQGQLLRRALTHRSWVEDSGCYEREEFLGDAILEWWATTRLYALGPDAPPSALTFARALLVSSGALALIGCRKLELHKCILHSSPVLEAALHEAAEQAQQYSFEQVVQGDLTFLWSPPKVISDVVEAILAAVFIDAGFQLEPVLQVLDRLFADIMPHVVLTTEVRDPYSRFLMLLDSLACKSLSVKVTALTVDGSATTMYEAVCSFHDDTLATFSAPNKSVARQLAAQAGLAKLAEAETVKRCSCKTDGGAEEVKATETLATTGDGMDVDSVDQQTIDSDLRELADPMSD